MASKPCTCPIQVHMITSPGLCSPYLVHSWWYMGLSIPHLSLIAQCISPCFIVLWSLAIGYSSPLQVSFMFNTMMYDPLIFVGSIQSQSHSFESKPFKFIPNNHLHCIRMCITSKNTKQWKC